MNSTPASLKRFPSRRDVVGRQADHVPARSLLRPRTSLCVPSASAGATRLPEHESRGVDGHWEPHDILINRKQAVHVLAPERCTSQSRDHRFDPFAFHYPSTTCVTQNALVWIRRSTAWIRASLIAGARSGASIA